MIRFQIRRVVMEGIPWAGRFIAEQWHQIVHENYMADGVPQTNSPVFSANSSAEVDELAAFVPGHWPENPPPSRTPCPQMVEVAESDGTESVESGVAETETIASQDVEPLNNVETDLDENNSKHALAESDSGETAPEQSKPMVASLREFPEHAEPQKTPVRQFAMPFPQVASIKTRKRQNHLRLHARRSWEQGDAYSDDSAYGSEDEDLYFAPISIKKLWITPVTLGLSRRGELYLQARLSNALTEIRELLDQIDIYEKTYIPKEVAEEEKQRYFGKQQNAMLAYFNQQVKLTQQEIESERKRFDTIRTQHEATVTSVRTQTENEMKELKCHHENEVKKLQKAHKTQLDAFIEQIQMEDQADDTERELALKNARIEDLEQQLKLCEQKKNSRPDTTIRSVVPGQLGALSNTFENQLRTQEAIYTEKLTKQDIRIAELEAELAHEQLNPTKKVHFDDDDLASVAAKEETQKKLDECQHANQQLEIHIAELNQKLEGQASSTPNAVAERVTSEAQAAMTTALQTKHQLEAQLKQSNEQLLQSQQQTEHVTQQAQIAMGEAERHVASLQEQLHIAENTQHNANWTLQKMLEMSDAKDKTIVGFRREMERYQQLVESANQNNSNEWREEAKELAAESRRLDEECQAAERRAEDFQTERDTLRKELEAWEACYQEAMEDKDAKISALKGTIKDLQDVQPDHHEQEALSNFVDELQIELKDSGAEIKRWKQKYRDMRQAYKDVQEENDKFREIIKQHPPPEPSEDGEIRDDMPSGQITAMEKIVTQLERLVDEERFKRGKAEEHAHGYFKQIGELSKKIREMTPMETTERELRSLKLHVSKHQTDLEAEKARAETIRLRAEEAQAESDAVKAEHERIKADLDSLTEENKLTEAMLSAERRRAEDLSIMMGNLGIASQAQSAQYEPGEGSDKENGGENEAKPQARKRRQIEVYEDEQDDEDEQEDDENEHENGNESSASSSSESSKGKRPATSKGRRRQHRHKKSAKRARIDNDNGDEVEEGHERVIVSKSRSWKNMGIRRKSA